MKVRRSMLRDLVTVQTVAGAGAYGGTYAGARTVRCNVDERRRLVRSDSGEETVSETTLQLHPQPRDEATGELLDAAAVFVAGSLVDVRGRTAQVITCAQLTMRGRTVAVEVTLT